MLRPHSGSDGALLPLRRRRRGGAAGDYDKELLFAVPRDHAEIVRLEEQHAAAGGLRARTQPSSVFVLSAVPLQQR